MTTITTGMRWRAIRWSMHDGVLVGRASALVLALTVGVSSAVAKPGPTAASRQTPAQTQAEAASLLHRAKEALGGAGRLDQVAALVVEGARETTSSRGIADVANRLEYNARWPLMLRWPEDVTGFVDVGMNVPEAATRETTARRDDTHVDELTIGLLFLCRMPSSSTTVLRVVDPSIETGLSGQGIEVVDTDGARVILALHPATGRPTGIAQSRRTARESRTNQSAWRVLRVAEYATINGLAFPRRLTEQSGQNLGTIWINEVRVY